MIPLNKYGIFQSEEEGGKKRNKGLTQRKRVRIKERKKRNKNIASKIKDAVVLNENAHDERGLLTVNKYSFKNNPIAFCLSSSDTWRRLM